MSAVMPSSFYYTGSLILLASLLSLCGYVAPPGVPTVIPRNVCANVVEGLKPLANLPFFGTSGYDLC